MRVSIRSAFSCCLRWDVERQDLTGAPPRGVFFAVWTTDGAQILIGASDTSIFRFEGDAWCREHLGSVGAANAFFGVEVPVLGHEATEMIGMLVAAFGLGDKGRKSGGKAVAR